MKISELRNTIIFEQKTKVPNGREGFDIAWVPVIETRGKLETVRGQPFTSGQNASNQDTHKLTIRYRDGLEYDYRVTINDEFYQINSIEHLIEGRKKWVELMLESNQEFV